MIALSSDTIAIAQTVGSQLGGALGHALAANAPQIAAAAVSCAIVIIDAVKERFITNTAWGKPLLMLLGFAESQAKAPVEKAIEDGLKKLGE